VGDAFVLPEGFAFGAATSGFQTEGGYNGAGQPANNWAEWEAAGRVERSGVAVDFWNDYEHHLDCAVAAGCDTFRVGVEWARCEPEEGRVDDDALAGYGRILDACTARGLRPIVTLHHFTHPAWLGGEFWLQPDSPEQFVAWVEVALDRMAERCRHWVTLNEINVYALQTWMTGMFPPGRRLDVAATVRTLDHMLTAHVLAYDAVKRRRPDAVVATNNYAFSIYELDRLLIDLLLGRANGVDRYELRPWLEARRGDWHDRTRGLREKPLRRLARTTIPLDQALPRATAAVYASPHERCLDVVQVDWYDPVVSHHLRVPGHRTAGGRNWLPGRMLWDDPPDPDGLTAYCEAVATPGLDVWIVENGLCNRVKDGRSYPRADGWDRPRYLREHLAAVVRAIDAGVPITTYVHWTLTDNYEWGSYEPRFGLYGIDRSGTGFRWSDRDSMGADAAAAYRRLIDALRAGDASVLSG
jgi:beta-glucosidase/6-phospho-beta-glucosidase/beta-galactosidase